MATTIYTITEEIGEGHSITGELDDVMETVKGWFDTEAVAFETEHGDIVTIGDQLNDLRNAMTVHCGYTMGLEEALGLKVTAHPVRVNTTSKAPTVPMFRDDAIFGNEVAEAAAENLRPHMDIPVSVWPPKNVNPWSPIECGCADPTTCPHPSRYRVADEARLDALNADERPASGTDADRIWTHIYGKRTNDEAKNLPFLAELTGLTLPAALTALNELIADGFVDAAW